MADIKQLKSKIQSTKNIKKITNAMEVISTIKVQKMKKKAEGLRAYMNTFISMVSTINSYADLFPVVASTATRELVIVVSSEK
jgi:F-type H+-transporting ATPase subunit gamma